MVALATDPARLGAYIKDPDAAMREAGITDVDQVILKSGQPGTIHARLSGQRFSFTPPTPMPTAVLVVDMVRPPGALEAAAADQPTVRSQPAYAIPFSQGSSTMFPNAPLQIVHPQIFPQVHPQIFPQIHPQLVIHPQIFPQIFPQVHPQIFPQIHPQLVIHPQIFPQIFPQVHPQIFPQIHPQFVIPGPQG